MYRIVSLLPSATEIVHCLGLGQYLVGRSHECDFPIGVEALPVCTAPKFCPAGNSQTIHDRVTQLLQTALSVYEVKTATLAELRPTHVITQSQCEVCAVSLADVQEAVSQLTHGPVEIISLQPNYLHEVWQDIERVGHALQVDPVPVVAQLKQRVRQCPSNCGVDRPRVACIEWIDPPMSAGNWIPELVEMAGGHNLFGEAGKHSPWLQWSDLEKADPDLLIFMPCGFDMPKTSIEVEQALKQHHWQSLRAVRTGNVFITDGNSFFNRPGPRLVESLEILAEIIRPDYPKKHWGTGWQRFSPSVFPQNLLREDGQ
jgi:iron complex transport system substrate-binding protein